MCPHSSTNDIRSLGLWAKLSLFSHVSEFRIHVFVSCIEKDPRQRICSKRYQEAFWIFAAFETSVYIFHLQTVYVLKTLC